MPRRRYLNFTTPSGVSLAAVASSPGAFFLLHDTGFLDPVRNWNHPAVDSPFWRFYHNPKPGWHLQFEGRRIDLTPGEVVLIPANTVFDCCGPREAAHLWIHFTVNRPSQAILEPVPQVLPVDEALRALIGEMLLAHRQSDHPLRVQRLHHLACALLHTSFSRLPLPALSLHPQRLAELLALIESAPHGELGNAFLAKRAGMSLERFIRWFRMQVGQTPAAYVAETRVRLAKQRLALTDKSIDEISADAGFPNRHYFSRVFARQVGCGPAEFRKRQRERKGV